MTSGFGHHAGQAYQYRTGSNQGNWSFVPYPSGFHLGANPVRNYSHGQGRSIHIGAWRVNRSRWYRHRRRW